MNSWFACTLAKLFDIKESYNYYLFLINKQTMKTQRFQAWMGITLSALALSVLVPSTVAAATCPDVSGKVVKVKTSYWLVKDGQRHEFVDSVAMQTWDRTAVTVKADCVKDLPVVGVINYRPGSRLVKFTGSPILYAVGTNMNLHPIDKTAAKQWYGAGYQGSVRTLPKDKFSKFTVAEAVTVDRLNDGALVKQVGKTQVYYVKGGQLVKVEGKLRSAVSGKVLALPAKVFAKLALSGNTVKSADLTADPITATVPVTEGVAPVVTPPTTPLVTPPVTPPVSNPDNTVETDLSKLPKIGVNYSGPFPAPEGLVLEGTIGATKYFEPTGTGEYRFRPKIDGGRSINCLDSTRTVYKSKGKNYDAGFKAGINYGIKDGDVFFPKYNDTPRGGNVGNQYFDQGFRVGYKHGYEVGNDYGTTYDCRTTAYKPGDYDADGWRKTTGFEKAKNLTAVYFPGEVGGYAGVGKTSADAYAWTLNTETEGLRVQDTKLNKDKPVVNLSRVEVMESVPEGAETSMTMEEVAKMSYDAALKYTNTKYNRICTLTEPTIETKTYGSNTFTLLTFVQICKPEAKQEATWKLQAYAFAKGKTSGNVFTTTFVDPFNLKKAGADEFDMSKLPSNDFIAQFLTKLQFN